MARSMASTETKPFGDGSKGDVMGMTKGREEDGGKTVTGAPRCLSAEEMRQRGEKNLCFNAMTNLHRVIIARSQGY